MFFLIGAMLVINALSSDEPQKKVSLRDINMVKKKNEPLFDVLNAIGGFNALLFARMPKLKEAADGKLIRADVKLRAEGFFFIKEVLCAVGITLVFLFKLYGPTAIMLPLVFFVVPDFKLKSAIGNREFLILRTFPEVIDLMVLCLSAGLDFTATLRWLTESSFLFKSPFIDELKRLKEETLLGKSKVEALRALDKRLQILEVTSLVRTLVIAENMGVSISETFERFSADVRDGRFQRGERQARMSAIKILFPLIFFILPVVWIVVMGPIVLKFMQDDLFSSLG